MLHMSGFLCWGQVVSSGVVEQLQSLVREDVLRRLSNMALAGFDPAELQVRQLDLRSHALALSK
jgi:hypothetical protein